MRRLVWILLAACSHPAQPGATPTATAGASSSFRAYVPPAALVSPGPATPDTKQCHPDAAAVVDHEAARARAALDSELRRTGSMLLATSIGPEGGERGKTMRGPAGERWLVVGETGACGDVYEEIAIDAQHEVYTVMAQANPAQTRRVALCQSDCRAGCGTQSERHAVVVEVPAGAHLGTSRTVRYPIDVGIDAAAFSPDGVRLQCPKKP